MSTIVPATTSAQPSEPFWLSEGFDLELIRSGPIPPRPRDWFCGVAWNTQHIYIFRDAEGAPLYVGMTHNPAGRWPRHKRRAAWWPNAETVDVWRLTAPDRRQADKAARAAELDCIRALRPTHNIAGVCA